MLTGMFRFLDENRAPCAVAIARVVGVASGWPVDLPPLPPGAECDAVLISEEAGGARHWPSAEPATELADRYDRAALAATKAPWDFTPEAAEGLRRSGEVAP